ncbi:hypothetical protein HYV31_02685 [candidate division WWE3 bacterium]|nr:hypothetical protein [candidate division WWE3 bacterium]
MNTSDFLFESKPKVIAQNLMFGLIALTFIIVTLFWLPEHLIGSGLKGLAASFSIWGIQSIVMFVLGYIRKFQLNIVQRVAQSILAPLAFSIWIAKIMTEAFFMEPNSN